jgi:hypothetical protein
MTTGRAIIHNPTSPDSLRRRQFLLDSITKSGLEWAEELEENRIVITYRGEKSPHVLLDERPPCHLSSR